MSRPLKTLLILLLVGTLAALASFGFYLNHGVLRKPEEVRALAAEIWPLKVPEGMTADLGLELFSFQSVQFTGLDPLDRLAIASYPADADEKSSARWSADTQIDWSEQGLTTVDEGESEVQIEGAPYPVQWALAEKADGSRYRSMILHLQGAERNRVVFRIGPEALVTAEAFQRLFP